MMLKGASLHRVAGVCSPLPAFTRPASRRHISATITAAMKATWNGKVVAESDATVVVENNHYFPPDSIKEEFFVPSYTKTQCGWKGTASYYSLAVDGNVNEDAAWVYEDPKDKAKNIKGYIAFWKGVKVSN